MNRAIFLDKDGTLVHNMPYNVKREMIRIYAGAFEALAVLQQKGYLLIVVSNQPGLALGLFAEEDLTSSFAYINEQFRQKGVVIENFFWCPHDVKGKIEKYA